MKLLKHKTSRDIAIEIVEKKHDRAYVFFYNTNWAEISGEYPALCGDGWITLRPRHEYTEYVWRK